MLRLTGLLAVACLVSSSCGSDGGKAHPADGATPDAVSDGATDAARMGPGCAHAGFAEAPFDDSATTFAIGEVVPDFTVETLRGPWTLSEHWGDCSMFTLVPVDPSFVTHDVSALVQGSEPHNTYLFFSYASAAEERVSDLREVIEGYLESQGASFQEEWTERFRYMVTTAAALDFGSALVGIETDHFVIDPSQRLRDAGSYRFYTGDFLPSLPMIQYASRWFSYERRTEILMDERAADPNVLVVPWVTEGYHQTDQGRLAIALPPASEMARYDRAEIVVKETCEPGSRFPVHYGVCPAWDVGHKITLCDDHATCLGDEHNQLFRHITGYHSGIWWREDVSHGLPWFREGGTKWMRTNRSNFFGTIDLHFIDDGDVAAADHISDARHLIDMGVAQFDAAHNDTFQDYTFTPPPGTVRVMLDARVQGGGNQAGTGCAEFCTHEHEASIGGQTFQHAFVMNNNSLDCAERAGEGVTSGQFGTWFFDRGSWCPGGPVERWQEDITAAVDLEGPNTMRWTTFYAGDPWLPGGGMTATIWLVFYGADGQATVQPVPRESCPNPPTVTIRDFSRDHPDFEAIKTTWDALTDGDPEKEDARGALTGVVAADLVEVSPGEWKPQIIWPENKLPYTTAASFDDWWRDSPDSFTTSPGGDLFSRTRSDTTGYFASNGPTYAARPLLDAAFGHGDEGLSFTLHGIAAPINTTFTVEVAGSFVHAAGKRIRIASKADFFVFVDHTLVLESGGFLDKGFDKRILALDTLGLSVGQTYDLHVFLVGDRQAAANPQVWIEHPGCE